MPRDIQTLIVVPENNTTMEPEISALCPALAPIPVARVTDWEACVDIAQTPSPKRGSPQAMRR